MPSNVLSSIAAARSQHFVNKLPCLKHGVLDGQLMSRIGSADGRGGYPEVFPDNFVVTDPKISEVRGRCADRDVEIAVGLLLDTHRALRYQAEKF